MNIFIDIETIPDQRDGALENAAELVKVPANYKKPEAIEKYRKDHAEEEYLKTGLKGIAGEICSIAWAFDHESVQSVCRGCNANDESDLLNEFFDQLLCSTKNGEGEYPRLTWIGHNVIDFDLRFLKQRSLIRRIRPPILIPADAKHGSVAFDTMKEWAGWKGFVGLDALCTAFGFAGKSMSGTDVWPLFQKGEFRTIREYNIADVELTRRVYNRMIWND